MTAADTYAAMIDAVNEQQARLRRRPLGGDRWAGRRAEGFRADPRRPLGPNLEMLAAYLRPEDVLLDVGGGAGRLGLPLALRCREVINVDPSEGMRGQFEDLALSAGIANARFVQAPWPAEGLEADVALTAHVTYFVRDIVPFVEAMQRAARRRVLIELRSVPPPMSPAAAFAIVHGERQATVPGHRELLAVLWEMDILPEVYVLPERLRASTGWPARTREDAIAIALDRIGVPDDAAAVAALDRRFDEAFETDDAGIWPRQPPMRDLLITWER
jgi:Methyltransferase domain